MLATVAIAGFSESAEAAHSSFKNSDGRGTINARLSYAPVSGDTNCHIKMYSYNTSYNSYSGMLSIEQFFDEDGDGKKAWETNPLFAQPVATSEAQPDPHAAEVAIYKKYNPKRINKATQYAPTRIACITGDTKLTVSVPRQKK